MSTVTTTSSSGFRTATVTASSRYRTAADWVHDLGDIPLERIIFDPLPGTATEDDLLRKVEGEKQLCELVDGTLVEKPVGYIESLIAANLIRILGDFVRKRKLGVISAPDATMRLSKRIVRLPDVAYVAYARMQGGKVPTQPVPELAPDLAVEVLSKGNTKPEMERKLAEYFAAGTKLVWIIDPKTRIAVVHTSPEASVSISADGVLDGHEVLPGLQIRSADVFEGI